MKGASADDIKNLTKSINDLVKTMSSSGKPGSKTTTASSKVDTKGQSDYVKWWEKQLELQEKSYELELESEKAQERQKEIADNIAKRSKDLLNIDSIKLKNQKAYGTELFKELDLTEQISELEDDILEIAKAITKARKEGNKEEEERLSLQIAQLKNQRTTYKTSQEQFKQESKINKLAEKRLESYKKITSAIKDPIKALEGLGDTLEKSIGSRFAASLTAPKKSLKEIATSGLKLGVVAGFGLAVKHAFEINEELVHMQRNLGVSAHEAHEIHDAINNAAMDSAVLGATTKDYSEAFATLSKTYGTAVANNTKLLESQVLLTKQIGMTNDQALQFQEIAVGTGNSAEYNLGVIQEQVEVYNDQMNASVSIRDVQKEVASVSKSTLATYGGNVRALTRAAIQAKKIGMSLDDTRAVSEKLLDIESSLESEMKANVLTGKSMNMNKARELALQGKTAEAAAEAVKQAGSYDALMKMGPIQQKAIAEAAGMTVDQLVKAGQEQKRQQLMGEKTLSQMTEADKQKLIDAKVYTKEQLESLAKEEQSATLKEKMVQLGDKLMKAFDAIASGPIGMMVDGLSSVVGFLSKAFSTAKKFTKEFLPEGSGAVIKGVAGITLGIVAVKAAFGKVKEFFGKSKQDQQIDLLQQIADNTSGGGGAGGAEDSMFGGKGKKKGLKRIFQAFKKGGFKGGMKSIGRMYKQAGGAKGMIKSAMGMGEGATKTASMASKATGGATKVASVSSGAAKTAGTGAKVAESASKGGGLLGKLSAPLKSVTKFLGPIMSLISGISDVASIISTARTEQAAGKTVDTGKLGKDLVKSAAYPIVNGLINLIPGFGTAISIADGLLGMFGWSPIKWASDHIIDLFPSDAFKGLGDFALGSNKSGASEPAKKPVKDALIRPGQPPITFDKGDLIMAGTNLLGEGGNSESGGNSEVAALLKELIAKVDQPMNISIGGRVIDEMERQSSIKRTYNTKIDGGYGVTG